MALYELRRISDNAVINLIEWDGVDAYTPPSGTALIAVTASSSDFTSSISDSENLHSGQFFGSFLGDASGSFSGSFSGDVISDQVQIQTALIVSDAIIVNDNGVVITGSLITTGSNKLIGNTSLTGSFAMSGSQSVNGYIGFEPVNRLAIPTNRSASYIYTSGSTNDLYFTQYQGQFTNTTRLRWLESALYTGILHGGVLTSTPGSTQFTVTAGEGLIIAQNAFTGSAPYPTVKLVSWPTQTLPITNSGSAKMTYVGINDSGTVVQQTVSWGSTDINQFDTEIELGIVLHLSGSVSTGVYNSPQISYGQHQQTDDFVRAFGPLKITGNVLQASGSTLSIIKTAGTSYNQGANYVNNPNHPSTVIEEAVNTSKIYRYYISGSTPIIDTGIANAGYTVINPTQRVNTTTGTLTSVSSNKYSIQRVFWIPNSPTNAFIVYYGNTEYASLLDATNAKDTEPFSEAPSTVENAIFLGWIAVAGGATSLTNINDATIIPGGIFRSIGGVGSTGTTPVSNTLSGLSDVSVASRTAGDLLYYNGAQWENTKQLNASYGVSGSLNINGSLLINGTSYTAATSGTSGTAGTSGTPGSSGTSGTAGTSGTPGSSGTSGTAGTSGSPGSSGTSGTAGTSGTPGSSGSSGTAGTSGAPGSSGTSGTAGTSGTPGSSGTSGTSGTPGSSGTSGLGTPGSSGTSGTSGTGFSTVSNTGNDRVLTSDGSSNAAVAESNLSFNGSLLTVVGSISLSNPGEIQTPVLVGPDEKMTTLTVTGNGVGGTVTFDLTNGPVFRLTMDGNVTSFTTSNDPPAGTAAGFTLIIIGNGSAYSATWNPKFYWPGGAPAIPSTLGNASVFVFTTFDQGGSYLGLVVADNVAGGL